MFPGPAVGGPALLVENALPADRIGLFRRVAEPHLLADVVGQIIGDKAAQLVAERQLFLAEAEIHRVGLRVLLAVPLTRRRPPAHPHPSLPRLRGRVREGAAILLVSGGGAGRCFADKSAGRELRDAPWRIYRARRWRRS